MQGLSVDTGIYFTVEFQGIMFGPEVRKYEDDLPAQKTSAHPRAWIPQAYENRCR